MYCKGNPSSLFFIGFFQTTSLLNMDMDGRCEAVEWMGISALHGVVHQYRR